MDAKYICRFCGRTNTKIEPVTRGLFSVKVGEREIVDKSAVFYRCANCGTIMCRNCCSKHGVFKKKTGVFSTKYRTECRCKGHRRFKYFRSFHKKAPTPAPRSIIRRRRALGASPPFGRRPGFPLQFLVRCAPCGISAAIPCA
jgi:hypothetical protein